jgi:hypothetical protein
VLPRRVTAPVPPPPGQQHNAVPLRLCRGYLDYVGEERESGNAKRLLLAGLFEHELVLSRGDEASERSGDGLGSGGELSQLCVDVETWFPAGGSVAWSEDGCCVMGPRHTALRRGKYVLPSDRTESLQLHRHLVSLDSTSAASLLSAGWKLSLSRWLPSVSSIPHVPPINPRHVIFSPCALLPPAEPGYARNAVDLLAFQKFLLYVHYTREHVERGAYTLRDQLKVQFKATQKAQINERKVADSKRRLALWVILLDASFVVFSMSP